VLAIADLQFVCIGTTPIDQINASRSRAKMQRIQRGSGANAGIDATRTGSTAARQTTGAEITGAIGIDLMN
jgi:hypothetical protein